MQIAPIRIRSGGQAVVRALVAADLEQNAEVALGIPDDAFIVEGGKVVMTGKASALARSDQVRRAYLGI